MIIDSENSTLAQILVFAAEKAKYTVRRLELMDEKIRAQETRKIKAALLDLSSTAHLFDL